MHKTESGAEMDGSLDRRTLMHFMVALAAAGVLTQIKAASADAPAGMAAWPKDAFAEKTQPGVLKALYGKTADVSDKITVDAPEIAENGAVVPVSVATSLPNVTSISILIPENPFTLVAAYTIPLGSAPAVSCRLKMGKTSPVIAVIESDGKLFMASKDVKVTLGGCGG